MLKILKLNVSKKLKISKLRLETTLINGEYSKNP